MERERQEDQEQREEEQVESEMKAMEHSWVSLTRLAQDSQK